MNNKVIILISLILAFIVTIPLIANISKVSELEGSYILKWSPFEKSYSEYYQTLETSKKLSSILKILLEIAGIFVVILTAIEYYKFYKLYKEEER